MRNKRPVIGRLNHEDRTGFVQGRYACAVLYPLWRNKNFVWRQIYVPERKEKVWAIRMENAGQVR